MPDFNIRSDSVNVEQIMEHIRARIREKRGIDYTEEQIRTLAAAKLDKSFDPRGLRSDLLEEMKRSQLPYKPPTFPSYVFEEETLYESHRAPLRWIRRLLRPILKLFFNPNPLIQALNIQSDFNAMNVERDAERETARHRLEQLHYEVLHNLVVEMTRMGIELNNLRMRVESLAVRLEFNERRARSLESAVVSKPQDRPSATIPARTEAYVSAVPIPPAAAAQNPPSAEGQSQRSRRRRRRRGRRGGASVVMGGQTRHEESPTQVETPGQPQEVSPRPDQPDDTAAVHAETAESIEQALAVESHPSEAPGPEPGQEPGSGQAGEQ